MRLAKNIRGVALGIKASRALPRVHPARARSTESQSCLRQRKIIPFACVMDSRACCWLNNLNWLKVVHILKARQHRCLITRRGNACSSSCHQGRYSLIRDMSITLSGREDHPREAIRARLSLVPSKCRQADPEQHLGIPPQSPDVKKTLKLLQQ